MSGLTLRERAEEAFVKAEAFELELSGREPSADETKQLEAMANEAGQLLQKVKTQAEASGTIKEGSEFFRTLNLNAPDAGESREERMAAESGIVLPNGNMTMADAFLQSPAYQELMNHKDAGGTALSDQWRGATSRYEVPTAAMDDRGMLIQNALITSPTVTTGAVSGDPLIEPTTLPGIDKQPMRRRWMRQKANVIQVNGVGWKYPTINSRTNNAAMVAESTSTADGLAETPANGYKPESAMDWDVVTGTVETIAHWMPMTRQSIVIAPQVRSTVERFLVDGIGVAEEVQFLQGDGNSPNLRGVFNVVNPYNNMHSVSVAGGNRFNAILAAMGLISQAFEGMFNPDCIVINPVDWNSPEFLGSTDGNGNWQFGGPASSPANLNPWGLTPIISEAVPVGTQFLGDFRWMMIADASPMMVFFADQHKDWAVRNMVLLLAERMVGFALQCEEAFAQVTA